MNLASWLIKNKHHFIGALKINKDKRPLKGEYKDDHWLFHEDNEAYPRIMDVILYSQEEDAHGVGILVGTDILVIDLDNKEDGINGVARWKELSDIPITYTSSSGKGAHVWVKNPFGETIKSTYAKAQDGRPADKAIELFSGHKQYLKLPDNDFDWNTLDLDALPELPQGFLKGVPIVPDASKVDATLVVDKLELNPKAPLRELHHYVTGLPEMDDYSKFFKFTSVMFALSFYQENVKKNPKLAKAIKVLWEHKCEQSEEGFDDFRNNKQWDAMSYLGAQGIGIAHLKYNSAFDRYPIAGSPANKALVESDIKQLIRKLK